MESRSVIAIAASFTADPVADVLGFWLDELGLDAEARVAPSGQVFQELLDPESLLSRNARGLDVLLVRLASFGEAGDPGGELISALTAAAARGRVPTLLCLCPPPPGASSAAAEARIEAALAGAPGVQVVTSAALEALYPVTAPHDPRGDALAGIPYTPAFFAALGTMIARRYHALGAPPYKVIAADCDHTLWGGVCGEDGPLGVTLDAPRRALQELLVEQRAAGVLLCLASKNEEADVTAVFATRPEMPLREAHFAARRVSWRPKPEGLRELSAELGLGLSSFVFLDDDPVERAGVRAGCPEVLVPELPGDPAAVPGFLRHLWALDRAGVTAEDLRRSEMVGAARVRARVEREAPSLEAFLEGLALEITTVPLDGPRVPRAAQLTRRTNQLNVSTRRRTDAELGAALEGGALEGIGVEVRDRFGDYGMVGVALFRARADALHVDTLLLSCRALGRGVEARMLADLGRLALGRGLARVEVPFVPTEKNRPALELLEAAGAAFREGSLFRFPAEHLAAPRAWAGVPRRADDAPVPMELPRRDGRRSRAEVLARIAAELSDPERILAAVRAHGRRERRAAAAYAAPRTAVEEALAAIWREVLGLDEVGIHDGFFELGGQSIAMIRAASRIRDELSVDVSPDAFFAGPTIERLAETVTTLRAQAMSEGELGALLDEVEGLSDAEARALLEAPRAAPVASRGPAGPGLHIGTVGIVTSDRPEALARALTGYVDNAARHGRDADFVIADDSSNAAARAACRSALGALARARGVRISYAGAEEKAAFVEALAARGIAPELARFALSPPRSAASSAGANRNALLLHTAGSAFFSADDDTVCRIAAAPSAGEGLRLTSGSDPADHWFFPDREAALAAVTFVDRDLLGLHEELLGRIVGAGEVMVTFNGLVGDCGWGAPFGFWHAPMGYLAMRGASLGRLAASAEGYRAACASREILRVVDRPCAGDAAFSMTTFAALDNRRALPPFCPLGRGQDNVFGATLARCFQGALFGHLPWALVHAPVEPRRFWPGEMIRSAAGVDLGRVILACLGSVELDPAAAPAARMRALGEHLATLGALPQAELDAFVGARLREGGGAALAWLDDRLAAERGAPAWWAADVVRYRAALAEAMDRPDYGAPLDLRGADAATRGRDVVGRFGALLAGWPDLVEAAAELRGAGRALAVEVRA